MTGNRAVVYSGPRTVKVEKLDYPKLVDPRGKKCDHGVIIKLVTTNICGSDLHIYRGRFVAPEGMVLGHENTGEVVETGRDVEFIKTGDSGLGPLQRRMWSLPQLQGAAHRHLSQRQPRDPLRGLRLQPRRLAGWAGRVHDGPLRRLPVAEVPRPGPGDGAHPRPHAPLGHPAHRVPRLRRGRVGPGSTVYIAGAGPVGRCAAASARLVGASCIIVGDQNRQRLELVKGAGFEVVDLSKDVPLADQIEAILGVREVDCGVDCVGFEAHGYGPDAAKDKPEAVHNALISVVRSGGGIGIPGVYTDNDPGAPTPETKKGRLGIDFGKAWIKSQHAMWGQCPVMKYNRELMQAILWGRMDCLGKIMNVELISLDQRTEAYHIFDEGAPKKFVIDPHGSVAKKKGR